MGVSAHKASGAILQQHCWFLISGHPPPTQPAGTWYLAPRTVEAALLNRYFHVWLGTETGSFFILFFAEKREEQSVILELSFCLKICLKQQKTWKQQLPIHHLLPRLKPCCQPHDLQRFLRKWKPLMTSKAPCGCERHLGPHWSALERLLTWQCWQSPLICLCFTDSETFWELKVFKYHRTANFQTSGRLQFCCSHFPLG